MEEKMTIYQVLDRLNLLLGSAKPLPLGNKVLISKEEVTRLLYQLEDSIAPEIKEARKLLEKEAAILNESRTQADQMLRAAEEEAT